MVDSVSVVVPVYNAAESLGELVERLEAVLSPGGAFEIILVNDASRDASWETIRKLCAAHPHLRGVDLMRNVGQDNAVLAGVRLARHAVVVTLDDDLQQPPEEIPRLLAELERGADVVYGVPERPEHSAARRLASSALRFVLARLLALDSAPYLSPFRAFPAKLREAFADYRGSFVTLDALLSWGAERVARVTVRHDPRRHGRSNYSVGMLLRRGFDTVTTFSVRPLKFASVLGFGFTALGLSGMAYTLGFYALRGLEVPRDTFLFAVMCMFAGIQLFTLGIIGEYLSRIHLRLLDRPPYAVREEVGGEASETWKVEVERR